MEKCKSNNENVLINIYRFFFTTVVILHHLRSYSDLLPFGGGYMATDFFFILSGLLLYMTFEKETQHSAISYLKRRFARLFFPLVFCNLLLFVISKIVINYIYPLNFFCFLKENLMIELFSCNSFERFNPPCWYLGMLILASFFVYILLCLTEKASNKKAIRFIIISILIILYFGVLFIKGYGNIYIKDARIFDLNALSRSLCGVSLGALMGGVKIDIPSKYRLFFISVISIIIAYCLLWRNGYSRFDIIIYIMIAFLVYSICFQNDIRLARFDNLFSCLGRASYVCYLIHFPIIRIMKYYNCFGRLNWKIYCVLYIIFVWSCSLCVDYLLGLIKGKINIKKIGD